MSPFFEAPAISIILHTTVVVVIALRVIMLRPSPGVALAWLLLVAVLPLLGLLLYILFGERRIGQKRARRMATQRADFQELGKQYLTDDMTAVDWSSHPPERSPVTGTCQVINSRGTVLDSLRIRRTPLSR